MTVFHIIPDHELGGGTVNTARLMRAFAEAGEEEAHVVFLPANASAETRAVFADLRHVIGAHAGRGSVVSLGRGIAKLARPGDIVHAQGTRAALAAVAAEAMGGRFRAVYTVRGFHGLADPGPLALRRPLEHLLAWRMRGTAFVSQADADLATATGLKYRGPCMVIENGIETPPVGADAPRDIDLLFVGRLVRQKWPEAFVETVARMSGAPRVVMVGAGELAPVVDSLVAGLAAPGFRRIDGLPPDETLAMMARARVLVMTSRWEGLPTVAIEAAQSGAVVAGFRIPPLAEVLGDAADELLTPSDPAALAQSLEALLADEARRSALAERLHGRARSRYAPLRMVERYRELYRQARAD